MPTFAYQARDHAGVPLSGMLVAPSAAEVMRNLRADGKYPVNVRLADSVVDESGRVRGGLSMSRKDLINLSMQLAIMVETGVTLSDALDCVGQQMQNPNVKKIVLDISQQVQGGSDFSSALQRHPRAFPRIFVALMSASEKSGMMSRLLYRANQYLRDEYETIRRVRGALTYPIIMMLFAMSTTTFLLAFVLPRFTAIYIAKKAALPVPTQILMVISDFMVHQWAPLVMGLITLVVAVYMILQTKPGARAYYYCQLNIPILGGMFRQLHLARGLRMVGTMAGAGVNLVDCVKTAHDLCANIYFRELWDQVSSQIQAGKQLSDPMFHNPLVPRSVSQMLHSAERSGKLAAVMEQVAGYAEQELKEKIADLTKYIEPLLIAVMGFIIGGVAIALMLPIFTISRVLAH
jgi:type IV pilus assembly protein PilC